MLLNQPIPADSQQLAEHYQRCATEGMVFHGKVHKEHFGMAEAFDPQWQVAALCWCAGGTEHYDFPGGYGISLKAGAALALSETQRYAYQARGETPFTSSMIAFPSQMTHTLSRPLCLQDNPDSPPPETTDIPLIETRLFQPGPQLMARMNRLAATCTRVNPCGTAAIAPRHDELEEQTALVADELLAEQLRWREQLARLDAVKASTRKELARRLRWAVSRMHEAYDQPELTLSDLASEACMSRYHFVRVFNAAYRIPPMRYLGTLRMEAAARLLECRSDPVSDIARQVGFNNRSAFHSRFLRHFGQSPARWRRVHRIRSFFPTARPSDLQ